MSTVEGGRRRAPVVLDGIVSYLDAGLQTSNYNLSNNIWTDISGYGRNGTLVNGVTFDSSNGGSVSFDGIDDYITIPTTGLVTDVITIDVWFKTNSSKRYQGILGSNQTEKYECLLKFGVNLETSLSLSNYSEWVNMVTPNNWVNMILVATSGVQWKLYKNGVVLGSQGIENGRIVNGAGITSIQLGRIRGDSANFSYSGLIGSSRIYNRALSAAEVLQNYNATKSRFGL